ncbi:MAG: zinc ribbon domain-containing protein [Thermoanaerobaculia bacterium]
MSGGDRYRRLVRCESCFRQFDAGGLAPGERFRCVCGTVLLVPRMAAQEAPVVRCASCGAPRAAGAANCTFCHAPFALGEAARNTLCPVCASRLGDDQRYCHSCGTLIAPETIAGGPTEFTCPACKPARKLSSRKISESTATLTMLECASCGGVWLGLRTFESLQLRAKREVVAENLSRAPRRGRSSAAGAGQGASAAPVAYRPCPVCRKLMVRRNFAATSGTVIDVCGSDGLWFDAQELDSVLAWIRAGGLERSAVREAEENRESERRAAFSKQEMKEILAEEPPAGRWLDVLSTLVEFILNATRRGR